MGAHAPKQRLERRVPERAARYRRAVSRLMSPAALVFEVLGLNRIWPGNPVNRKYRCLDLNPDEPAEVEQPAGAFLMVGRAVWEKLGGFDEAFRPVWFEDVDFLKRARDAGYRIRYVPSVVARHQGGHAVRRLAWGCRQACWYGSLLRYACKHLSRRARRGVSVAVVLGFTARAVMQVFRERSLKPMGVCVRVARFAGSAMANRPEAAVVSLISERW